MENDKLEKVRHSLSHLMTMAVMEKYPQAGLGVGPTVENGFYQDYDLPQTISEEDLDWIEKRMKELIKEKIEFKPHQVPLDEALVFYKNDPYKRELIQELKEQGNDTVTFYKSGWFDNLCDGPHVADTSQINEKAFKLTKVAGAYWRGDEKNKMLTRIYGIAFESKDELNDYLCLLEEAKRRDHRKLGKELDLFTFSDLVGKGLPMWTKYGATIRRELENFIIEEEIKRGYDHVVTPELAKVDLYRKSGHYPYYKDTMYPPMQIDDEELILRPMTCPHHFMLYLDRPRSYRELPMRIAELARLFRYEKSGELTGLLRVRSFCLADAHIICTTDQAKQEIEQVMELIEFVAQTLGLKKGKDYSYCLSLGDRKNEEKYYKNNAGWDQAEAILKQSLNEMDAPHAVAEDEAAFYGPKIDIQMRNVLGKEDTAFTVQYDFCMPERFDLRYIDADGEEKRPIVIHRSSIGAIERTFGFLLERYAGAFPLWLSPVQVALVPVSVKHVQGAKQMATEFRQAGIRVEVDSADETVGYKVRQASKKKMPYIVVVGDSELSGKKLSVRVRGQENQLNIKKEKFINQMLEEIAAKK